MKGERKQFSAGKRVRFRLEHAGLLTLAWAVPKFPRKTVQRFGHALGWLAHHLSPALRRVARENLDAAFADTKSPAEKRRIAQVSLQTVAATLLTLFWSPRLSREHLDEFVDLDTASLERVRALKAQGKPIIFVTLHYGDWEMIGLATGFYGIPVTVVQEAMKNEPMEQIFVRLRSVSGHRLVPSRFAATTLLKTLKRGGCIALLIDQNATRKRGGVWLDFFGLPVFNTAAIGTLALHSGAAIVPGVAHPLPGGRVRIVYGPEIQYMPTGDYDADTRAINQKCLRYCEQAICNAPEHWMWSYKRWTPRATVEQGRYPAYSRYVADIAPRDAIV